MSLNKVIIIGGVAGGMSTAARLRRLNETVEIVVYERDGDISIATCGMPYYLGQEITERGKMALFTPEKIKAIFNIDVKVKHEVLSIDRENKKVIVKNILKDEEFEDSYDKLVLCPGAKPISGVIPGDDHKKVFTLRNLDEMDAIFEIIPKADSVAIVGAGFVGLEVAEAMTKRGLNTSVIEMQPQIFPPIDYEMTTAIRMEMENHGVVVRTSTKVLGIEEKDDKHLKVSLSNGETMDVSFVVLCIGVVPETKLAQECGLQLGLKKSIKVSPQMRTSDKNIYACGDAVEAICSIRRIPLLNPLAGPANRQGRIIAANLTGHYSEFKGVHYTAIIRVFGFTIATTGMNEKTVVAHGMPSEKVYANFPSHAGYISGWSFVAMKLIFSPITGVILGAQACGRDGVQPKIEAISAAIQGKMTVFDIAEMELCYSPPYGSAKDIINNLGFMGSNLLKGLEKFIYDEEFKKLDMDDVFFLDVREPEELDMEGVAEHSVNIPLGKVRDRVDEIPRDKHVVVTCRSGVRAHHVTSYLRNLGYERVSNYAGGMMGYHLNNADELFRKMIKAKIF